MKVVVEIFLFFPFHGCKQFVNQHSSFIISYQCAVVTGTVFTRQRFQTSFLTRLYRSVYFRVQLQQKGKYNCSGCNDACTALMTLAQEIFPVGLPFYLSSRMFQIPVYLLSHNEMQNRFHEVFLNVHFKFHLKQLLYCYASFKISSQFSKCSILQLVSFTEKPVSQTFNTFQNKLLFSIIL